MPRLPGSKNRKTIELELKAEIEARQQAVVQNLLASAPDFPTLINQDPKKLSKDIIQAELAKLMAKIVAKGEISVLEPEERSWVLNVYKTLLDNKSPEERAVDKLTTEELTKILRAEAAKEVNGQASPNKDPGKA